MDPEQMLERCPHSPQRSTGWLEGWRLTFGGEDIGWDGALSYLTGIRGSHYARRAWRPVVSITGAVAARFRKIGKGLDAGSENVILAVRASSREGSGEIGVAALATARANARET
jgi:hypothetical protein